MYKLIVFFTLAISSTFSFAQQWEKISDTSDTTNYVDRASVRKNGYFFKIWGLTNFKIREPDGVFSQRYQDEYDCRNESRRTTYLSSHFERFADGGVKFSSAIDGEWRPIPPGTIAYKILQIFCS